MTYSEIDKLVRELQEDLGNLSYFEEYFKDCKGNPLHIGDFIRINRRLHNKYICQMMYQIKYAISDGIYFEKIGLYKDEYVEDYDSDKEYEMDENQWSLDKVLRGLVYVKNNNGGTRWLTKKFEDIEVKITDISDDFEKIQFSYSATHDVLAGMGEDDKRNELIRIGDAERYRDFLIKNKEKAIQILKNVR